MNGMVQRLKRGVHALAYITRLSAWRSRAQRCVRFVMFHDVGDAAYPLGLFERQMQYLSRFFTVCRLPEALARLRAGRIAGDEVVLTFDDGLESHATVVYPVLERLHLPASFFVCPGLIERREGIWTLETRALLAALVPHQFLSWAREAGAPLVTDIDRAVGWMKGLVPVRRQEAITRLRVTLEGQGLTARAAPAKRLVSWEQLAHMDPGLAAIESQGLNHPTLTLLEPPELERELRESQELLERRLGRRSRVFCYPDGAYDANVIELTRRYYDAALTTVEGFARPGDDLYLLRRIPVAPSLPLLAWRLHRPTA